LKIKPAAKNRAILFADHSQANLLRLRLLPLRLLFAFGLEEGMEASTVVCLPHHHYE
jgi:hypothetical protein